MFDCEVLNSSSSPLSLQSNHLSNATLLPVRKKMSDCPRPAISDEHKAKISNAQKWAWKKRLKLRIIKEKLYLKWEENIAEAAKIGWSDQQELDWDSYEKMDEELIRQQIQRAEDKVRVKEIAKLRAAKRKKKIWLYPESYIKSCEKTLVIE